MPLSDIFTKVQAALSGLCSAIISPPSTRVPLTNAEIKVLRQAALENLPLDRNTVLRVCGAALDARKRSRRYGRAIKDVISASA